MLILYDRVYYDQVIACSVESDTNNPYQRPLLNWALVARRIAVYSVTTARETDAWTSSW